MGQPYVGEIKMFAGNFAPNGWAFCNGQLVAISENETLFNLIGTTYGGDGQQTFALPNLQSRVPVHQGSGFVVGQAAGTETVTLTSGQMPSHSHAPMAQTAEGTSTTAAGKVWAKSAATLPYSATAANADMNAGTLGTAGGNQPHDNMVPFLALNFIISLYGIFPSPN